MVRGEFRFANGLVIPNNITLFGAQQILAGAFQGLGGDVAIAPAANFWVALVVGNPTNDLQFESLAEPTIGLNGYTRQAIARSPAGWPTKGTVNLDAFVESAPVVFAAAGGNFSFAISRMALVTTNNGLTGSVIALSAALPSALLITPTTPLLDRTFNYRVYLG